MTKALTGSAPIIGFGRPYTPELMGWFDDFSATGVLDAAGGIVRVALTFNAFDLTGNVPSFIPLNQRLGSLDRFGGRINQYRRCPGGAEVRAADGSNVLSASQQKKFDCTESARASGVYPENAGR
jgi:phospholipid/cholesterol/gamma-HCH transport system substrate-binding protein